MSRFFVKNLLFVALIVAIAHNVKAEDEAVAQRLVKSKNVYTIGQAADTDSIIYNYEYSQSYSSAQDEISLDFDYPSFFLIGLSSNTKTISQITVFVETDTGASAQVYLVKGGVDKTSASLQIEAQDVSSLNYRVIIYGQ